MNISPAAAILASLLLLLGTRFVFGMSLARYQSRKAQKRYRADIPLIYRWFFLSAPNYVRDRYNKLERKVIKARATIRALQVMNVLLHILLAAELLVILIVPSWCSIAFTVFLAGFWLCIILDVLIEWCNHPNFERMRRGQKPRNW